MRAQHIIDNQFKFKLDHERLDKIVATIISELEQGSGHWDLPFDQYVDERMGDLDWEGDGDYAAYHDENADDGSYEAAKTYILSKIPPALKRRHAYNRRS